MGIEPGAHQVWPHLDRTILAGRVHKADRRQRYKSVLTIGRQIMDRAERLPEETTERGSMEDRKEEILALLRDIPPEQMLPLPEDPDAYFDLTVPGVFLVPLARLQPTHVREKGIERALPFMYAAAHGIGRLGKRKPINVSSGPDGMYHVVDGNSTYAIAVRSCWESIPAVLVETSSP